MRHIKYDSSKINYPKDWHTRAAAAMLEVESATTDKRSDVINKHSTLWAELRPELAKLSNSKCWYTEAPQTGTDTDVDHFRPKNAVKDVKHPGTNDKHPGYWWKAFDPENYRYSCIVANRRRKDVETDHVGGKADHFPIWEEVHRAWCENDDCDVEQPLLIDPCKQSEVALLTFGENGEAMARHSEDDKPRLFKKADRSIELYHLNHTDFVKARIEIRDKIKKYIADAKRYYKLLDSGDAHNEHSYERTIEHLRDISSERAPFSRFALTMLEPYKTDESLEAVFL